MTQSTSKAEDQKLLLTSTTIQSTAKQTNHILNYNSQIRIFQNLTKLKAKLASCHNPKEAIKIHKIFARSQLTIQDSL